MTSNVNKVIPLITLLSSSVVYEFLHLLITGFRHASAAIVINKMNHSFILQVFGRLKVLKSENRSKHRGAKQTKFFQHSCERFSIIELL